MANYVYDDAAMTAVIDVVNRTSNVFEGAQNAVSTAANTLRTISSAGGDLGANIGGTVLGNINSSLSSATDVLGKIKKVTGIFERIRSILNGASSILDTSDGSNVLENIVAATSDEEAVLGTCVDISKVFGDVMSGFSGDPILSYVGSRIGSMAESSKDNVIISNKIEAEYADRLRSGDVGMGEYFAGAIGAEFVTSAMNVTDLVGNVFGIDIPTSWIDSASHTVGSWFESGYKAVEGGVKSLFNWWS